MKRMKQRMKRIVQGIKDYWIVSGILALIIVISWGFGHLFDLSQANDWLKKPLSKADFSDILLLAFLVLWLSHFFPFEVKVIEKEEE